MEVTAGRQVAQGLVQWLDRGAEFENLTLQLEDPLGMVGALGREDLALDFLDVVMQALEDVGVVVDYAVNECVEDTLCPPLEALPVGLEGSAHFRGDAVDPVADRHDEVGA